MSPLTACTITVTGGTSTLTYDWTGNLDTYEIASVNVGSVNMTAAGNLEVSISSTDDNVANNNYTASIGFAEEATTHIRIDITFDNWPEENSWEITNDMGAVVADQAYSTGNPDASSLVEDIYLPSTGCYQFTWFDAYGDGLNGSYWGFTDGSILVKSIDNDGQVSSILWDYDGSFGFLEASAKANVLTTVGIEEIVSSADIRLYPNPASDRVTFEYTLASSEMVSIELVDMLGNLVMVQNAGKKAAGANQSQIELDGVASGVYIVNLRAGNSVSVSKLTVR